MHVITMTVIKMKAYTYIEKGRFELLDKPKPQLQDPKDAIVRVTLSSICSSDLHIKHGSVPRAVPGITVGHEMVGIVSAKNDPDKMKKTGWTAVKSENVGKAFSDGKKLK